MFSFFLFISVNQLHREPLSTGVAKSKFVFGIWEGSVESRDVEAAISSTVSTNKKRLLTIFFTLVGL